MNAKQLHSELEAALKQLESTRVRLESLRDWTRGEVARQNTRDTCRMLDKNVPSHLRENAEPALDLTELPPAMRAFQNARNMLRNAGLLPKGT